MLKILVLAEKPSVGKEIARVVGCKKAGQGAIFGDKYIVTWALGHLVTLEDPEHYGNQYKSWNLESLPMIPDKMDLKVIPETSKQFKTVRDLLRSNDVSSLIIATDAGREGELVARWIIEKAGFKKPVKRLWISSQTDKAIKDGFSSLKDGKDYVNLYFSAQARAEADWLVGLNVTRALTCKHNAQLSAGRVQTPTLALIVEREEEIRKFIPVPYYYVRGDLGSFFVTYKTAAGHTMISDLKEAERIAAAIKGKAFTLKNLSKTKKSTPPPLLYDLTELQRDANKLYSYSPKQTLQFMQSLYERHKVLSYPRTDSRYLTDDIVPTLPERLKAISVNEYGKYINDIRKTGKTISKTCVNNGKVSDHHAIIPTEQYADLTAMSQDELRIYKLVVKRFLAVFYPAYQFSSVKAEFECESMQFGASGREIIDNGWKTVQNLSDEDEEDEQNLPTFEKGEKYLCKNVQLKSLKTTPPPRYTEATLLSAMENPSKFIRDKEMREFIGGGLGTPATRADIIEKLFSSFYVEKSGKDIVPTAKGIQLIKIVPGDLREPLLTAKWESRLEEIKSGKLKKSNFIKDIEGYTGKLVSDVIKSTEQYKHENLTKNVCPTCGKYLLEVNGKHGKMLLCQDRECGYRENISKITGARCPNCHKPLELFGNEDKKVYVCRCGFREKEEAFKKRMEQTRNSASKSYVHNYLKNQDNKKDEDNPLAAALKKAFEDN